MRYLAKLYCDVKIAEASSSSSSESGLTSRLFVEDAIVKCDMSQ